MRAMSDRSEIGEARAPDAGRDRSLRRVAELAAELGAERAAEEAKSLAERLEEGRFYVACVGQFKRGKSTLLGALVGERILPTGILPVTTVPTVLRWGRSRGARVRLSGGDWIDVAPEELAGYVSEEFNAENAKGVRAVEVFLPSALLADGMCLVDTPGLGSIFAGNTAATRSFVPHVDAALVVLGTDPPIGGEELELVERVGKQVRDLLIVLNKADKNSDAEREVTKSFTSEVLQKRLGRPAGPIYEVSAEDRLQGRGPEREWRYLLGALEKLVRESGRGLVQTAGERGLRRLGEELLTIVAEEKEALARPIEDSERRIQGLRQTISKAESSLRDLGYLFMAEQHHLSNMFLGRRKKFLSEAMGQATGEFRAELARIPRRFGPKFRRDAMRAAQTIAQRHVLPWLQSEEVRAEEEYRRVASRFVEIGNEFLGQTAEAGMPELARMPHALDSEKGFRVRSHFRFENLITIAQPASPLRYVADMLLAAVGGSSAIERDAQEFMERLMETNSTRVQSDLVDRVKESHSGLEVEIRKILHEVCRTAERALDHARAVRAAGITAIQAAAASLDGVEREIRAMQPAASI